MIPSAVDRSFERGGARPFVERGGGARPLVEREEARPFVERGGALLLLHTSMAKTALLFAVYHQDAAIMVPHC